MLTPGLKWALESPYPLFGTNQLLPSRPLAPVSEGTLPECQLPLPLYCYLW